MKRIREHVAAKQLRAAMEIVDERLTIAEDDLEARGWRGRLLAWSGKWTEAEAEYRCVLEHAPGDADILLGLADVLLWRQRYVEALSVLARAEEVAAGRADLYVRRGRAFEGLRRTTEARAAYREALRLAPLDGEARAGVASLNTEWKHELQLGADVDRLPFGSVAETITAALTSRLGERWRSRLAGDFNRRFGEDAARGSGSLTYRPGGTRDWGALTGGVGAAHDRGVIPKAETFLEYGRGFKVPGRRFVRGIEPGYRQFWAWYDGARVVALAPRVVLYFPRDCIWSVQVTAGRTRFTGTPAEWQPAGLTRLQFPVVRRLTANVYFAVGTENFARADQIGRFSARTWGGSMRVEVGPRQGISFVVFQQDRSQGRSQTSAGLSYAIRF